MTTYYDRMYLEMAKVAGKYSRAEKLKVGCVIVKDRQVISIGINGTPSGWWTNTCEHVLEDGSLKTNNEVLHAEQAALLKLAKSTSSANNASLYLTHSPCVTCALMIKEAGITNVYYAEEYRSRDGVVFLQQCGVNILQVD